MRDHFGVVNRYNDRRYQSRAAQGTKKHSHACDNRSNKQGER
jgi:hypothetical protein